MNIIYYTLDEAREEIKQRWGNQRLKKSVEDVLGHHLWPKMKVKDAPAFSDQSIDYALQIDEDFVIGAKHAHEIEDSVFF